jgi:transposase
MTPIGLPFILPGFEIDEVSECDGVIEVAAHSAMAMAECPFCHQRSDRVHSYYQRSPADAPVSDRWVWLRLTVRRFRCQFVMCPKVTFAERLPDLVAPNAQRTERLTAGLRAVAFALGGQSGGRLAWKLKMPASGDTLLRIIRRTSEPVMDPPNVLGVDDWAKRRGRIYGTILVDLERHRVIDLLNDRTAETIAEWLKAHTSVAVVTRDRSTEYARGIALGAPHAQQVADRWHLLVNLREAVQRLLDRLRPELQALVPLTAPPKSGDIPIRRLRHLPAAAEAARQERRARRIVLRERVHQLRQAGRTIWAIARQLKMGRRTVYRYLSLSEVPELTHGRRGHSLLDPHIVHLTRRWLAGCRNAAQLWREIKGQGYPGTRHQVAQWAYERREQPHRTTPTRNLDIQVSSAAQLITVIPVPDQAPLPVARQLVWLFLKHTDQLEAEEVSLRQQLLRHPLLAKAKRLVQDFQRMVRERRSRSWTTWLKACDSAGISELSNFAAGLRQDEPAVRAALTLEWSNGQTEGHVNRLKLLKRQMYGRASFDLLRRRCLGST